MTDALSKLTLHPEYRREYFIAPREQSQTMRDAKWESENTWPKQIFAGLGILAFIVSAFFFVGAV